MVTPEGVEEGDVTYLVRGLLVYDDASVQLRHGFKEQATVGGGQAAKGELRGREGSGPPDGSSRAYEAHSPVHKQRRRFHSGRAKRATS